MDRSREVEICDDGCIMKISIEYKNKSVNGILLLQDNALVDKLVER